MTAEGPDATPTTTSTATAWLAAALVGVTIAGGYAGFLAAARLDLAGRTGAGLLALAAVTGAAVVFSPCSFPLLVTLLGGANRDDSIPRRRSEGFRSALAIAVGAAAFLLVAGVVVGMAGEGLASVVGFSSTGGRLLRGGVAAVLVGAGLIQLGVITVPLSRLAVVARPLERRRIAAAEDHRRIAQVVYGFAFVLAGFG